MSNVRQPSAADTEIRVWTRRAIRALSVMCAVSLFVPVVRPIATLVLFKLAIAPESQVSQDSYMSWIGPAIRNALFYDAALSWQTLTLLALLPLGPWIIKTQIEPTRTSSFFAARITLKLVAILAIAYTASHLIRTVIQVNTPPGSHSFESLDSWNFSSPTGLRRWIPTVEPAAWLAAAALILLAHRQLLFWIFEPPNRCALCRHRGRPERGDRCPECGSIWPSAALKSTPPEPQ